MTSPPLDERGLPPGYELREDWELTPRQVQSLRDAAQRGEADVVLIDCRTPREHAVARIEGAALLPLQELPARVKELLPHRDRKVVVFCHHGMRSLRMAAALRQQGFGDAWSMAGGIDLWSQDIDPDVPRY